MNKKIASFTILVLSVCLIIVLGILWGEKTEVEQEEKMQESVAVDIDREVSEARAYRPAMSNDGLNAIREPVDRDAKLLESLEEGFIPTQEVGELGSLNGAIYADSGFIYAETAYERLPDSPLIRFTDDMVWKDGDDYVVKRDAMRDQANHIQEASVALSVSARIEWGQLKGFRLVEVPQDTIFSKLGIVSGDVLLSINGGKPDMEPMALMFVNMVAKNGQSEIEVEHKGQVRKIMIRAAE